MTIRPFLLSVSCILAINVTASTPKFSMSVKATSFVKGGDLAEKAGRAWLIDWLRANGFSKVWLESYRHNIYSPTETLVAARNEFRAAGFEVCGLITPTCLQLKPGQNPRPGDYNTCFSNPEARKRLREEVARCAKLFDTILYDDFLFASCGTKCPHCRDRSAAFRQNLITEVCEELEKTSRAANPKCRSIIKYPCWYQGWASAGMLPERQVPVFGACWVGNETRDAGKDPTWAYRAYDHINAMCGGRCGGVWFDPLDSKPEKFVEQAYYSILSGAPEVLVHCYDYMLSMNPGTTPYGESFEKARECGKLFVKRIGELHRLAEFCGRATRGNSEMQPNGVSLHYYTLDGKTYVARLNTKSVPVKDSLGEIAANGFEFPKVVREAPEVRVDGARVMVEDVRCSAMPVNIRWPGHQRELDQTEVCGMVRFELQGCARLEVTAPEDFKEVKIRPLSRGIVPKIDGRKVSFGISRAGAYSVEFDGRHGNLHVFADPPMDYAVKRDDPKTRYFGPGEHEAGVIEMKSGETVFLDRDAVVYGRIVAKDADHIRILGRGILDMSRIREREIPIDPKLAEEQRKKGFAITNCERWDAIRLEFCDDVKIDGIVIRDSLCYNIRPVCCRGLDIGNVKLIGNWRYNSDGIDMHNCENVRIHDSFIRTFDDSICVKGFDYMMDEGEMLHDGHLHDVFTNSVIERCTVWCDWGRALEFGAETRAKEIRDITFRDCDVIGVHDAPCELQNCDYADIHDVRFEDIRIELDSPRPRTTFSASAKDFDPKDTGQRRPAVFNSTIHVIAEYSKDGAKRGRNRDVVLKNIKVSGPELPRLSLRGYDAEHRTTGIIVDGIYWNGREVSKEIAETFKPGPFADPPKFLKGMK